MFKPRTTNRVNQIKLEFQRITLKEEIMVERIAINKKI